jgi:hypothetical protein
MSSDVAILLYGSSFLRVSDSSLDSELAFATRVMRESRRTGVAPFRFAFLSAFSVPRSRHPRPSDARSPSRIRCAPLQGADSCPKASLGPLPQILSSRRGSGSRRHPRWASMYRRQRTNQKWEAGFMAFHAFHTLSFPWPASRTIPPRLHTPSCLITVNFLAELSGGAEN